MTLLILGLTLFVGTHLVSTMTGLRQRLIERFGDGGYKGLYSLGVAAGLILTVYGYSKAPYVAVWDPPLWLRHITFLLMVPVFPLLIASQLPGQMKRYVPHPMLMAVKLWAVAHLLSKGTLAAMLLYGVLLAWAVYDLISVKRRQRAGLVTVRTGPFRNDVIAVMAGLALYVFMLFRGHWLLFGVPVLPN